MKSSLMYSLSTHSSTSLHGLSFANVLEHHEGGYYDAAHSIWKRPMKEMLASVPPPVDTFSLQKHFNLDE